MVERDRRDRPRHDPQKVVAQGAAVRAGMMAGDDDLVERIMTDVAPFTLGVAVSDNSAAAPLANLFLPIIERNTVIPASREKRLVNSAAGQTIVAVRVFQGESPFTEDNVALGTLSVPIAPGPARSSVR